MKINPLIQPVATIEFNSASIPVYVIKERRRGYRASFTKRGLNIRVPNSYLRYKQKQVVTEMIEWAQATIAQKPEILRKYQTKMYENGHQVKTFDRELLLKIKFAKRQTIGSKIIGHELFLILPFGTLTSVIEPKHISQALVKHYKPWFKDRLEYWNELFAVQHQTMRLKYNSSNWGSCSSKKNINLSTRLLLCPLEVIDYVMVHELAHLIHANHSQRFWGEVARVMPDYKRYDKWLKTKGSHLDF